MSWPAIGKFSWKKARNWVHKILKSVRWFGRRSICQIVIYSDLSNVNHTHGHSVFLCFALFNNNQIEVIHFSNSISLTLLFFPFNQFRCLLLDDWNKIYRHRNRFWTFWAMPRRILCYVYSLYLCAQLKQGSHRNSKMGLTRALGNSKENSVDVVVPQAEYMCFFFVFIVQRCLFHLSGKLAAVRINKNITKNHTHNNTQIGT